MPTIRHGLFRLSSSVILILVVGGNVAVFSLVNALFIREQPVGSPESLVVVGRRDQPLDPSRWSDLGLARLMATGLFASVSGQVVTRESFVALQPRIVFPDLGRPVEIAGVTSSYFDTLGVNVFGRSFRAAENLYDARPVAVISDELWRDAFGRDPNLLGKTVAALPESFTIVGIAPPGFQGGLHGEHVSVWLPHHVLPRLAGANRDAPIPMLAIARLEKGVPVAAAQAWFAHSDRQTDATIEIIPLLRMFGTQDTATVVIREHDFIAIVTFTSLLVLIAGCTTLTGLVLVHYHSRRRELAIRAALGANRLRLSRQLLCELSPILIIGAVSSIVVGQWIVGLLSQFKLSDSIDISRLNFSLDWRIASVGATATIVSILGAGAVAAIRITGARPSGLLANTAGSAPLSDRARGVMLFAQTAVATLLLLIAALLVRTVINAVSDGAGFDVRHTLFVKVHVGTKEDRDPASAIAAIMEQIRSMPGVELVSLGPAPLGGRVLRQLGSPQLVRSGDAEVMVPVGWISAGPAYLQALGVQSLLGDNFGSTKGAVVSSALAEELWPGLSPIGEPIRYGPFSGTVIGVIDCAFGSVKIGRPAMIVSFEEDWLLSQVLRDRKEVSFVVRAREPEDLAPEIMRLVRERFTNALAIETLTGLELVRSDLGRERLAAWLFSGFGLIAMILGIGSVFGVVGYSIQLNRQAYAIMVALGATPSTIVRRVVWQTCGPTFVGAVVGAAGAFLVIPWMRSYFVAVGDVDAAFCVGAVALLVASSAAAAIVAAAKIRFVEPVEILKSV